MNDIIIHISDLHFSDQSGVLGDANKHTYLTCDDNNINYNYVHSFLDKVKSLNCKNKYLIITGDITNIAENIEFKEAEKYIKIIMEKLDVPETQILLIPGDHDIHRESLSIKVRTDHREGKPTKGKDLQKEKFENFSAFYKNIKNLDFNFNHLVFDEIIVGDIVLCGINSNRIVDENGGHGFLDCENLEAELISLKNRHQSRELILCFHHNLEGEHENTFFGQWNEENKKDLKAVFDRQNIKCILHGNEHTPNSKFLSGSDDIIVSDAGAFSSKGSVGASFKIYEIFAENGNLHLNNSIYSLRQVNSVRESNFGNWIKIDLSDIKNIEKEKFILRQSSGIIDLPVDLIPVSEYLPLEIIDNVTWNENHFNTSSKEVKIFENYEIQNKLYQIIKEKKLFHQGHFHWSETSRAHNWIDIARLLEDRDDLYFVKNAIIDVIENLNLIEHVDLIIGLGYEGNIISSKASIKFDVPYTYLPYSYRWEDNHKFENQLNFDNNSNEYKKVLIITDVVNDGRTIRYLVGKEEREKKFFDKVDEIIVVSLFYTGHQELNDDILNYNKLDAEIQKSDVEVNNIKFYCIKQLKVEKCPYGDNYREECFILRDNLHCVHKFYNEKN